MNGLLIFLGVLTGIIAVGFAMVEWLKFCSRLGDTLGFTLWMAGALGIPVAIAAAIAFG